MRDKKGRFLVGNRTNLGSKRSAETILRLKNSHLGQVPWDKGKKRPEMSGAGNPFWGRKHTKEALLNISLKKRGRKNPHTIDQNRKIGEAQKGRIFTKEHRDKIRIAHIGKIHSTTQNQKHREWMVNHPNRRYVDTGIELKMEAILKANGIKFKKQTPLCGVAIVDFYLPEIKTVIQCDGCYYHNCPIHRPEFHKDQREKDRQQDMALKSNGFRVLRFWEHEINHSVEKCLMRVI